MARQFTTTKEFNKIPFINFKLKELPELPKTKIISVLRPSIKEYEVKE